MMNDKHLYAVMTQDGRSIGREWVHNFDFDTGKYELTTTMRQGRLFTQEQASKIARALMLEGRVMIGLRSDDFSMHKEKTDEG